MPNTSPRLMAEGIIRPSRFCKIGTADDKGLEADANEDTIGISMESTNQPPLEDLVTTQNAAVAGQHFKLYGDGDECLVEAGAAFNRGARLKSDADGKAVGVATSGTTLQRYGAKALESAAASGELVRVQVLSGSERPALA